MSAIAQIKYNNIPSRDIERIIMFAYFSASLKKAPKIFRVYKLKHFVCTLVHMQIS